MPPTYDVIPVRTDGSVSQTADGALIIGDSSAETLNCCCEVDGSCMEIVWQDATNPDCPNPARNGSSFTGPVFRWTYQGKTDWQTGGGQPWESVGKRFPGGKPAPRPMRCHRLYVWEDIVYSSNEVDVASTGATPSAILTTNGVGQRTIVGGPFETTPGSGVLLDTQPYWWETCLIGGWEDVTATHWFQPTIDYLDRRRATSIGDGTYTVLLLAMHQHWKFRNGFTLTPPDDCFISMVSWRMFQTA